MTNKSVIIWFRQDLRLDDNPALRAACANGAIIPVYIHDQNTAKGWPRGGASCWWLHHSLAALNRALGGKLILRDGKAADLIPALTRATGAAGIYWNTCYEPWRTAQDRHIQAQLTAQNCAVHIFRGNYLYEPHENLKADGTPYRVFTPFYRHYQRRFPPPPAACMPPTINYAAHDQPTGQPDDLGLLQGPPWHRKLETYWQPGEAGAQARLAAFLNDHIAAYQTGRDQPASDAVSRLSPHLHFGEISPRRIWQEADNVCGPVAAPFLRQLVWREFCAALLHHNPALPEQPLQEKFTAFPWRDDPQALEKWQRGDTGYPLVDAGMRELWETGAMHNRVRMVTASFLVKNLLIHWLEGEKWFWDTLVDADLANNAANWQWVAGCGADAAPYFRIFNPTLQGQKFDPQGTYIRRFVPELAGVPDKFIHEPWKAPEYASDYPPPIGDHATMRARALAAYQMIR